MGRTVDVTAVINERAMSRLQKGVVALCLLVAIFEGFDVQAIGYVAPAATAEWGLSKGAFGTIFGIGTFGILVGNFVFGTLADSFGRRRLAISMVTLFGVMSLATSASQNFWELTVLRFVMGFGMGGVMPNITALVNEYTPARLRITAISIMYCGVPFGGVLGGLMGAVLITEFGWRSILLAGGIMPLLLVAALIRWLPESINFLTTSGKSPGRIAGLLNRIDPAGKYDSEAQYVVPEKRMTGIPVKHLFLDRRTATTILVWIAFFSNLLCLQLLFLWLPTILKQAGLGLGNAVALAALINSGALAGAYIFSLLINRFGAFVVLVPVYALATTCLVIAGIAGDDVLLLAGVLFICQATVNGSQCCLNAVASNLYPTAIRSTAMGWALGIGRVGSIVGPYIGGIILNIGWGGQGGIFLFVAPVALVTTIAIFFLGRTRAAYDKGTAAAFAVPEQSRQATA